MLRQTLWRLNIFSIHIDTNCRTLRRLLIKWASRPLAKRPLTRYTVIILILLYTSLGAFSCNSSRFTVRIDSWHVYTSTCIINTSKCVRIIRSPSDVSYLSYLYTSANEVAHCAAVLRDKKGWLRERRELWRDVDFDFVEHCKLLQLNGPTYESLVHRKCVLFLCYVNTVLNV